MKRIRTVPASDAVNRYGSRFAVEALVGALWDNCEVGNPLLLSHDFTRPIGWTQAIAVHMEPGSSRLVGHNLIPESKDEMTYLGSLLNGYLQKRLGDECEKDIEELRGLASDYLLGRGTPLCRGCVALVETDLAKRALPDLFSKADKEGLVSVSELRTVGPGVYRVGEFAVFAHPSFRRSFYRLNTLNTPFLRRAYALPRDLLDVRIALDPDMLGLASTYNESVELEYWWGPKFDDDLASIPIGVTSHGANEADLLFHGISRTEFWWQSREDQQGEEQHRKKLHVFEAEELRDIPVTSDGEAKYGCRYVHSIVDETTKKVTHLDGAVRNYPEERMIERLEADIMHFGRDSEYTKLWRVDGDIDIPTWKGLLSDYFRDNRLVGEYLGAQSSKEEAAYLNRSTGASVTSEGYVPYSINRGDGLRLSLSFDPRPSGTEERTLFAPETLTFGDERVPVIDIEAVELKKAVEKRGASLRMPKVDLMKYEDGYVNLPLILHGGDAAEEDLRETLDAIQTLVRTWDRQKLDIVASYSVAFPVEGKEAIVSVFGHVSDLADWFSTPLCLPPTSVEELRAWASKVSDSLSKNYRIAANTPSLNATLKDTGIFWIDRCALEDSEYTFGYSEEHSALGYEIKISKSKEDLIRQLETGEISPAFAMLVTASECSACGASYLQCGCSKLLDEEVAQRITEVRDAFMYWTDRPIGQDRENPVG
jgi:hypothetical protein